MADASALPALYCSSRYAEVDRCCNQHQRLIASHQTKPPHNQTRQLQHTRTRTHSWSNGQISHRFLSRPHDTIRVRRGLPIAHDCPGLRRVTHTNNRTLFSLPSATARVATYISITPRSESKRTGAQRFAYAERHLGELTTGSGCARHVRTI